MLVHAITKYTNILKNSRLDKDNKNYRQMYLDKKDMQFERKIKKVMDKGNWFQNLSDEVEMKQLWRQSLTDSWKGARSVQTKVSGYEYLSTLNIPNTAGSELFRAMARVEPGLTRQTGFAIKLVESGCTPLFLSFQVNEQDTVCPREDCIVCSEHDGKGSSKCRVKSVIYTAECLDCKKIIKQKEGER